jgi:hypothetical protein
VKRQSGGTLRAVFWCNVGDPDDRNGLNGDDKNPGHGNPRIVSPRARSTPRQPWFQVEFIDENGGGPGVRRIKVGGGRVIAGERQAI